MCQRIGSVEEVDEELWEKKYIELTSPFLCGRKEQTKRSGINTEVLCKREKRHKINSSVVDRSKLIKVILALRLNRVVYIREKQKRDQRAYALWS
jgi:hypothetical protein